MNPGGSRKKSVATKAPTRPSVIVDLDLDDIDEETFCRFRFTCADAHKDWHKMYKDCPLTREITYKKSPNMPVAEILGRYKDPNYKGLLKKTHSNASTDIAKEFFVNGKYRSPGEDGEDLELAYVRKKRVSFSAEDLREYYDLPQVTECEFRRLSNRSGEVEVIPTLSAGVGGEPSWVKKAGKPRSMWLLKKANMNRAARWWVYFLCDNVWGIQHVSDVHYERAILVYCCMTGKAVDFPSIILDNLKERMVGTPKKSLGFAHFITHRCEVAGVNIPENMKDLQPTMGKEYIDLGGPHPPGHQGPQIPPAKRARGESSGTQSEPQMPEPVEEGEEEEEEENPPRPSARDLMQRFIDNQEIERKEREIDRKWVEKRNRRDKKAFTAISRGITELQARFDALNPGHHFDPFTPLPSSWSTSSGSGAEDNVEPMNDEEN